SSNKEDSGQYQKSGPKLSNDLIDRNDIEVAQQEEGANRHQGCPSPEFHVSGVTELLVELIEWGDKRDALQSQFSFLGCVVGLKRHVDIESECQKTEQRFSGGSSGVCERHQR